MVVVCVVVGDKIVDLSQVDEQTEASVGFSLREDWAGVLAKRKCCNDAVTVHQC